MRAPGRLQRCAATVRGTWAPRSILTAILTHYLGSGVTRSSLQIWGGGCAGLGGCNDREGLGSGGCSDCEGAWGPAATVRGWGAAATVRASGAAARRRRLVVVVASSPPRRRCRVVVESARRLWTPSGANAANGERSERGSGTMDNTKSGFNSVALRAVFSAEKFCARLKENSDSFVHPHVHSQSHFLQHFVSKNDALRFSSEDRGENRSEDC